MDESDSNFRETDLSVRDLRTLAEAESLRDLIERDLKQRKQEADHITRIEERADGLFDLLVLQRIN